MQSHSLARDAVQTSRIKRERVREALEWLEVDVYGQCLICGNDIAPELLDFAPTIPYCIACAKSASNRWLPLLRRNHLR
jgi:DnaK suppressor protein